MWQAIKDRARKSGARRKGMLQGRAGRNGAGRAGRVKDMNQPMCRAHGLQQIMAHRHASDLFVAAVLHQWHLWPSLPHASISWRWLSLFSACPSTNVPLKEPTLLTPAQFYGVVRAYMVPLPLGSQISNHLKQCKAMESHPKNVVIIPSGVNDCGTARCAGMSIC